MKKLHSINKFLIYFSVFLLPLFFAPLSNVLSFPKQALLIFFGSLCFFLWLLEAISKGGLTIRYSILDFFILIFVIVLGLSTIFSRWRWGSFWGWPQDTASSFLTYFFFAIYYLLIVNILKEKREILLLQYSLVTCGFLVALIGISQLFGKFFLPFGFTKTNSFNTIGTFNSWGMFLAALMPIALTLLFKSKGLVKITFAILTFCLLGGVVLTNYWVAWLGVLFSMIVFLVFGIARFVKIELSFLTAIMVLFAFSLLFGVFKVSIPGLPQTPLEISPSLRATFDTSRQMLANSLRDLILGWGPGTFKYGWSKYKSSALNQTIFWNIRFTKGGCQILEVLSNEGVLGLILFLSLICFGVYVGLKRLLKSKQLEKDTVVFCLAPLASFLGLSALKFFYPANLSLGFLWWVFLAIVARNARKEKSLKLAPNSRASIFFAFFLVFIFVFDLILLFFESQRIIAEMKYNQALNRLVIGDNEGAINFLLGAIRSNPQQEIFWQDLSQIYLTRAQQKAQETETSPEERTQRVQNFVAGAVAAAKRATEINPANVANWQIRGFIYRSIIGWSQGSFEWADKCYQRALELEPTNPFILVELSRTYLAQAALVPDESSELLEKAENYAKKAIDLKPDYALAFYQQALIYEARGKRKEAISTLEGIKQMAGFIPAYNPMEDVGLAFQLGVLYYRDEQYDKAKGEFERAIRLAPNYSNARYFLGLVYDKEGNKTKAIEQFEEIAKLNPENEQVKRILANLKEGKSALEGIATEARPIEEKPE